VVLNLHVSLAKACGLPFTTLMSLTKQTDHCVSTVGLYYVSTVAVTTTLYELSCKSE